MQQLGKSFIVSLSGNHRDWHWLVPRLVPLSLVIVIVIVVVRVIVVFSVIVIAVDTLLCNNWETLLLYLFPAIIQIGASLCQDWFLYHLLPFHDDILPKLPPYG